MNSDKLMKSTIEAIEREWEQRLGKLIPEDERLRLYSLLTDEIGRRQLVLVFQKGYDEAFFTTSLYAGCLNPYEADSVEYDYFAEGIEQGVDELGDD